MGFLGGIVLIIYRCGLILFSLAWLELVGRDEEEGWLYIDIWLGVV